MLDSDQEPSYNLSKNLLLLPRILKLKDMVDDSTPLFEGGAFICWFYMLQFSWQVQCKHFTLELL